MSDREVAFNALLSTLGPLSELMVEFAQCVFNAGAEWQAAQS
jgi:hypothetical protein